MPNEYVVIVYAVDLGRAVERPAVEHDPVVGLVADEVDRVAVASARVVERGTEPAQVLDREDPAAGVVRRVDEDGPRPGRDRGRDRLDVEVERGRRQGHADRGPAGRLDEQLVEEPGRRREDDLVARLEDRPERDRERRRSRRSSSRRRPDPSRARSARSGSPRRRPGSRAR